MAVVSKFPLLRLPHSEILRTIRVMSLNQRLQFSLFSKRCKDLVKSIRIEATSFRVHVFEFIGVYIEDGVNAMAIYFYEELDMYWGIGAYGRKKKLTAPHTVSISVFHPFAPFITRNTCENNTLPMQYWLKHLQDIFNYPKIDRITFCDNSSQFDIDDIKELFETATQVWISNTGCYAFNQMVIQKFLPVEKFITKPANYPNAEIPGKILMQNFGYLEIDSRLEGANLMTLDELLLINSKKIYVGLLRMSAKQINKFIKLWQRGSNPRMDYLGIDYTNVNQDDNEVIMRGISHQIIRADQKRRLKPAEIGMPEVVEGGIDFFRKDGVKATILFRGRPFPAVEMVVWFDHCVMES